MKPSGIFQFFVWWLIVASFWAFVLFGLDKWRAKHSREPRISESTLLLVSALGGWLGGLLGLMIFRHKTAKVSFLFQFFVALIVFTGLVWVGLKFNGT